jgi:CNT family concentrative nucleoside transporter
MQQFTGILGILAILGACWAFSTDRKAIRWKVVGWGVALQLLFALIVLKCDWGQRAMSAAGDAVNQLLQYATVGATFVFGPLADTTGKHGVALAEDTTKNGFVFAFAILPTIIFMAAFFAVLYYFGIMQIIIRGAAWVMTRIMGVSGAESLDVAASIFMGQTEAPLTIRPFLDKLTRSEMMTVMTAGMAHVSGGIMYAYIAQGAEPKHLLGAVIMTAPGTLLIAKTLVPETETTVSGSKVRLAEADETRRGNLLGAIAHGTSDGLNLAINVAAMLIAFLALIALLNGIMGWVHGCCGWFPALRARRLAHRHSLEGRDAHREPVGHPHGRQRIDRLRATPRFENATGPAFLHHCDVRVVRICQFKFHRHSDWRHRRAGALAQG